MSQALCKGIAVVIDDGVDDEKEIKQIISKIQDSGIPVCALGRLDLAEKVLENLLVVNFIIIDWNMLEDFPKDKPQLATPVLRKGIHQRVVNLIKRFKEICFAPVFLFTEETPEDIEEQIIPWLRKENLYFDKDKNFVLVRHKGDLLKDDRLLEEIADWIENSPPIYLLKCWQTKFLEAFNRVSWELHNTSPGWPGILWKTYKDDGMDPECSINDTLYRLVMGNTRSMSLTPESVLKAQEFEPTDLIEVLRRISFIDGELDGVKPGDIFKKKIEKETKYYLNVRPECDTTARSDLDETDVYLIEGEKMGKPALRRRHKRFGFVPIVTEGFVFFIEGENVYSFRFNELTIEKYRDWASHRICRLLPPHITEIQQRFSSFIGRYGIPALPEEVREKLLGEDSASGVRKTAKSGR